MAVNLLFNTLPDRGKAALRLGDIRFGVVHLRCHINLFGAIDSSRAVGSSACFA